MPRKTKKLKGGSNIAHRLKTGNSLRKSGSNLPKKSSGRKRISKRTSSLRINSSNSYELSFTIRGVEDLKDVKKVGKFETQGFIVSDRFKVIKTVASVDEKINDIIEELNSVMGRSNSRNDVVYWDIIKPIKENPDVSNVVRDYLRYKFLNTKMRFSTGSGELALLEVKKL